MRGAGKWTQFHAGGQVFKFVWGGPLFYKGLGEELVCLLVRSCFMGVVH